MKLGSLQTVLGYNHAFHNLLDFNLLVTFTSQTKQIEDQCLIIMVTSGSRIFLGIKLRKCNYHNLAYFIPKIYFSEYKIYSSWEWRVSFMRNPSLPRTTCVLNLKDGGWNSLTEMWNSPPFFASLPNQNETLQLRLNVLSCLASPDCRTEIPSQTEEERVKQTLLCAIMIHKQSGRAQKSEKLIHSPVQQEVPRAVKLYVGSCMNLWELGETSSIA